ncbi:methyl-accepting chemotaxis protein [Roseateles asaccharophilus]|uniref:Methyl-accepting chemotaxis protein n=1 Tax=Roseateles asaccharophilus TaxID=582607 RepID=A0ABU2A744_9BURK|nr:methyl-accepting chemotaxis protein [Roseateles asaccharophilus]MDR7333023.1 methyl-accepting chemotaxis protein [Roseateles asaccharophilus]
MLNTIKSRLIAICMLIVVAAVGVATLASYLAVSRHARSQVHAELVALGDAQAGAMGAWVRKQQDIVSALAPAAALDDPSAPLEQALKSGRLDLAYIGSADKRMVSFPDRQRAADYDPTARPWYKLAAATPEAAVITAPYIAASTQKLVVTFARAVVAGGDLKAVAGSDVALDDVIATLNRIKPTSSGLAFLVDKGGRVIAHPNAALSLKPVADWAPALDAALLALAAQPEAALAEARVGEQDLFLRSSAVPGTDWTLVLAADRGEALAALSAVLGNAGVALVLIAGVAALLSALAVGVLLKGLARVRDAMDQIGSGTGDLTQRLPDQGRDEIADIARSFNQFVAKIETVLIDVRATSQSIAVASREIAAGSQDLSQRTEESASSLQQTASSMEQLTSTVGHSADAAAGANQLAGGAADAARQGGDIIGQVVTTMERINEASRRIADIIGTIDGIAFQTNILALNAAVEAARAGEQGRGFAVVASEVRALAQRSAQAAKEIKSLINASVERVDAGSSLVGTAGTSMGEIVASVQRVTDIMAELSASAREQSQGIQEVNQAVGQLDQVTQQNAALVEESAAAAESLKEQAQRLADIVGVFRLSGPAVV